MPFLLCTYVRDSYNGYGKYPPGALIYESKVGVFKLNTPIRSAACVLNEATELAVPKVGTVKIRYMRGFRLFAMYVRTEPVHTYIAKTPKRTICAILYAPKVVPVNLTSTTQVLPSCHGGNSVLMVLDKMSSTTEGL